MRKKSLPKSLFRVLAMLRGLFIVLKYSFKKQVTIRYRNKKEKFQKDPEAVTILLCGMTDKNGV